jgi:hypothetical protein
MGNAPGIGGVPIGCAKATSRITVSIMTIPPSGDLGAIIA